MSSDLPILTNREGLHLALGGGAARALAHVGVLRALEEAKIPIASICGTSMGSLVGAMYALHPDAAHVSQTILEFVRGDIYHSARYKMLRAASRLKKESSFRQFINSGVIIGRTIAFGSVIPFEDYFEEVKALLPDKGFQNTEIPFMAIACELRSHKEIIFYKGKLRWAIMASCAIPGIYPSITSKTHVYVDGSWMNLVPVLPLKHCGAEKVFAISVGLSQIPITTDRTWKTVLHAFHASFNRLQERQLEMADLLITPDLRSLHWAAFDQFERAEELGYQCATENMDAIKRLLERPKRPFWHKWLQPKSSPKKAKYAIEPEYRGIWEIEKI